MPKPRRTTAQIPAHPGSEETFILDPGAMDNTQILDPHAMDKTLARPGPELPPEPVPEPLPEPVHEPSPEPNPNATRSFEVAPFPIELEPTPALELESIGPAKRGRTKVFVAAGAVLVVGLGLWVLGAMENGEEPKSTPTTEATQTIPAQPLAAPVGYQDVMNRALGGDPNAMRTLATVYTYGLGTPPNREEGLRWYRKAAALGSKVAQEELKQIEGPIPAKP